MDAVTEAGRRYAPRLIWRGAGDTDLRAAQDGSVSYFDLAIPVVDKNRSAGHCVAGTESEPHQVQGHVTGVDGNGISGSATRANANDSASVLRVPPKDWLRGITRCSVCSNSPCVAKCSIGN